MAKNSTNIFIPTAYSVWTAPLGTAAPTSPAASPSASWYEVGYLSDAGITEGHDINSTNIFDLLGTLVGVARNQEQRPFTFEALEDNRVVRELRYPGSSLSTGSGTAEVQTVTVTATGGTFTLTGGYGGSGTTAAITAPGTATAVQTAVRTLPGYSTATVTGSAGGPYVITFPTVDGDVGTLVLDTSALTGGSATIAVTTPGVTPINTRAVPGFTGQNLRGWLVYAAKGSKHKLFVINNGEASHTGTVGLTGAGAAVSQFTLQPFPDTSGNFMSILDDDPAQAATIAYA